MNDDELRRLLSDAVSDVQPVDRLDQIRAAVHSDPKVVPMSRPRPWRYAVVGVAATLAVIGGIAYAAGALPGSNNADSGPIGLPTRPSSHATTSATDLPVPSKSVGTKANEPVFRPLTLYYVGDGPRGPVLYRQSIFLVPGEGRLETAVNGLLEKPDLPQYRTSWKPGWITDASRRGDLVDVAVDGAPSGRPSDMDEQTAVLSVQQVVYAMQAATHSHDRVRFTRNGKRASSVLGVPTDRPLAAAPLAQTESLVSIDQPQLGEGLVGRGPQPVSGLSNTANGEIEVRFELNGRVMRSKIGHAAGSGDLGRLYPWKVVIDTNGLPSGRYLIVASGPDPTDPSLTATDRRPFHIGGHP